MKPSKTIHGNTSADTQPQSKIDVRSPILIAEPQKQRNNPLHGLTLEVIVTALVAHFGWAELAERIPVRCFSNDPSIASSLKFLRKTPWARDKVEGLYAFMLRDINRTKPEEISGADGI